jgi:hypothetical protein
LINPMALHPWLVADGDAYVIDGKIKDLSLGGPAGEDGERGGAAQLTKAHGGMG